MKKTLFAAVLGIACIGAFAFKSNSRAVIYYYKNAQGQYIQQSFPSDVCPGEGNLCKEVIPGQGLQQLYEVIEGEFVEAERNL